MRHGDFHQLSVRRHAAHTSFCLQAGCGGAWRSSLLSFSLSPSFLRSNISDDTPEGATEACRHDELLRPVRATHSLPVLSPPLHIAIVFERQTRLQEEEEESLGLVACDERRRPCQSVCVFSLSPVLIVYGRDRKRDSKRARDRRREKERD